MLLAEHQLHHTQSVESESRMSSLFVNLNMVFVQTGHEVKVSSVPRNAHSYQLKARVIQSTHHIYGYMWCSI